MKTTLKSLNKLIEENGNAENTEATRFKGEYWLLHICKNNTPVPLFHSKKIEEVKKYFLDIYGGLK